MEAESLGESVETDEAGKHRGMEITEVRDIVRTRKALCPLCLCVSFLLSPHMVTSLAPKATIGELGESSCVHGLWLRFLIA